MATIATIKYKAKVKGTVYNKVPNEYLPIIFAPITEGEESDTYKVPKGTYQSIMDNPGSLVNVYFNLVNSDAVPGLLLRNGDRSSIVSKRIPEADGDTFYLNVLFVREVELGEYYTQSIKVQVVQILPDDTVLLGDSISKDMRVL